MKLYHLVKLIRPFSHLLIKNIETWNASFCVISSPAFPLSSHPSPSQLLVFALDSGYSLRLLGLTEALVSRRPCFLEKTDLKRNLKGLWEANMALLKIKSFIKGNPIIFGCHILTVRFPDFNPLCGEPDLMFLTPGYILRLPSLIMSLFLDQILAKLIAWALPVTMTTFLHLLPLC